MNAKKPLLFLMVGLLAISFALPAMAVTRPDYMIDPEDVPGWYLYKEGHLTEEWNWSGSFEGFLSLDAWYQIWINNESGTTDPAAWANATKAVGLLAIDMSVDLNKDFLGISIWDIISSLLRGAGFEEKTVSGLDECLVWSAASVWAAIGYHNNMLFTAVGWGSETPPSNPFESGVLTMTKAPADTGAEEADILALMGAQGLEFPPIPGFELITVFLAVAVLTGVIFLLRKDQLSLLKN